MRLARTIPTWGQELRAVVLLFAVAMLAYLAFNGGTP